MKVRVCFVGSWSKKLYLKNFQNDEKNLVEQVKSQDKIIKFLKQRLSEAESRMDEFNKMKDVQASSLALIFFLPPYAAAGAQTQVSRVAPMRDFLEGCSTNWSTATAPFFCFFLSGGRHQFVQPLSAYQF